MVLTDYKLKRKLKTIIKYEFRALKRALKAKKYITYKIWKEIYLN